MKCSFALSFLLVCFAIGSSAESNQHLRSVTVASEDVTSARDATIPDIPRELKKAKGNAKKASGNNKPKTAKGLETVSPSSKPSSRPSSQPSFRPSSQPQPTGCDRDVINRIC